VPRHEQVSWCSDNFLNIRALRKACDIYSQVAVAACLPVGSQGIKNRSQ
jgi:hypothetical protein